MSPRLFKAPFVSHSICLVSGRSHEQHKLCVEELKAHSSTMGFYTIYFRNRVSTLNRIARESSHTISILQTVIFLRIRELPKCETIH